MSKHGVHHTFQLDDVKHRVQATMMHHYGVFNPTQLERNKQRSHTSEAHRKRHETMKRNGTYGSSKPEENCYELLCAWFGIVEVERQVAVAGTHWPIDFYVKPIDTYVQFDGVYWHGLDRPIDVIAEHKTPRDAQIHKKFLTDRAQDAWFAEHGLKLIRVTDQQFDICTRA